MSSDTTPMTPILPLVIKDLRRLGGGMIVFAIILVLKWLVGLYMISGGKAPTSDTAQSLAFLQGVLIVLNVVLAGLLLAGLIHEDPLVGTDAQWTTRPIHPIQMLLAKATGILVMLGMLPICVTFPWWLLNGLTGEQILHAALDVVIMNSGIALIALPFAVLTRTTGRFLYVAIGTIVGWQMIISLIHGVVREAGVIDPPNLSASRAVLFLSVLGVTSLIVIFHQYITRRTARSIAVCLSGFALACTIPSFITRDIVTAKAPAVLPVDGAMEISIALERIERTTRQSPLHLRLVFKATGAPPGYALHWHGFGQQTLQWAAGRQDVSGAVLLDQSPTAMGIASLLDSSTEPALKPNLDQRFTAFLRIPPSAAPLLAREVPRYTLEGTFRLVQPRLIATGPAAPGTVLHGDGHTTRVVEHVTTGRVLEFLTVETSPARLEPTSFAGSAIDRQLAGYSRTQLFIAGPSTGVTDSTSNSRDVNHTRQRIAGIQVLWRRTKFMLFDDMPTPEATSSGNGLMLGALYTIPALTVRRTVNIDRLPVPME